jgi:hypothetical protein
MNDARKENFWQMRHPDGATATEGSALKARCQILRVGAAQRNTLIGAQDDAFLMALPKDELDT